MKALRAKLFGAGGIPVPGFGAPMPPKLRKAGVPTAMVMGDAVAEHGSSSPMVLPFGGQSIASGGCLTVPSFEQKGTDEVVVGAPLAHAVLSRPVLTAKRRSTSRRQRARTSSSSERTADEVATLPVRLVYLQSLTLARRRTPLSHRLCRNRPPPRHLTPRRYPRQRQRLLVCQRASGI